MSSRAPREIAGSGSWSRDGEDGKHKVFVTGVTILLIVGMWIPQLGSSLRLDETATAWIVKDGFAQVVQRAAEFQGESPAYFLIEWVARRVLGSSEIALRALSLAAMLAVLLLVTLVARRLFDHETARLSGIVIAASEGLAFAAGDARPYAIATASLAGAALALLVWMDTREPRYAVAFVVLAVFAIYLQYLSAVVLGGFLLAGFLRSRNRRERTTLFVLAGAVAMLVAPTVPQLLSLARRRHLLAVTFPVTLPRLAQEILPPVLVAALLIGILIAALRGRASVQRVSAHRDAPAFVVIWVLVLPVTLFLISIASDTTLFDPRFFFFAAPGTALLAAWGVRMIEPAQSRRLIVTVLAIASVVSFGTVTHSPDDWRGAAGLVNTMVTAETPVLVRTAFIESTQTSWLTRPGKREYLLAPLATYAMRGKIFPLPYDLRASAKRYVAETVQPLLATPRIVYVSPLPDDIGLWLLGRLESSGFHVSQRLQAGSIAILVYERGPDG